MRLPSVAAEVVRALVTVVLPPPLAADRPSALRRSALPEMLRSEPVPVVKVTTPAAIAALVPDEFESVAAPPEITAFWTPLARSIAFKRWPAVPLGGPLVPK